MNYANLIQEEKRLRRELSCCRCSTATYTTTGVNGTLSPTCSYRFFLTIQGPNGNINTVTEESSDTLAEFIAFLNNKYKNFKVTFSLTETAPSVYDVTVDIKSKLTIISATLVEFCPCDITVTFDPLRPATSYVVYFWQGAILVAQTNPAGGNTQVLTIQNGQNYQICIEELFNSGTYALEKDGNIPVPFLSGDNTTNCGSDIVEGECNYYVVPGIR